MPVGDIGQPSAGTPKRAEARRVLQALDQFCASLAPGDRVPTHSELMRRFGASERMVLRALDELRRGGRIVRRAGAGTFVTDRRPGDGGASALGAAHARTIVALARPDRSFFDRCVEQLSLHTEEAGLDLVFWPVRPGSETRVPIPEALGHPRGFLLFGYFLAPLARRLRDGGARVVVVGTPPLGVTPDVPCVYGAQEHGGYLATKHLLSLGHRRLAFAPPEGDLMRSLRWQGCLRAVREAQRLGQSVSVEALAAGEADTWQRDPARAAAWACRPDARTGLMAWNDHEGARILSSLSRAGVKVPEDLSLVGYDALPEGELVHPSLTTVDPHLGELLHMAVGLLTQADPLPASHTATVVPALLVRESTAPPPRPEGENDAPSAADPGGHPAIETAPA